MVSCCFFFVVSCCFIFVVSCDFLLFLLCGVLWYLLVSSLWCLVVSYLWSLIVYLMCLVVSCVSSLWCLVVSFVLWYMDISYWQFGTLPIGIFFLSNLDSRQLKTYPITFYGHFWNIICQCFATPELFEILVKLCAFRTSKISWKWCTQPSIFRFDVRCTSQQAMRWDYIRGCDTLKESLWAIDLFDQESVHP